MVRFRVEATIIEQDFIFSDGRKIRDRKYAQIAEDNLPTVDAAKEVVKIWQLTKEVCKWEILKVKSIARG